MRIIAGKYRSRKLKTLPGLQTRPTLDHVKEAIFNSIGYDLSGFIVLDVFGGSGALSFEALSRGAKLVHIIEQDLNAYQMIKTNAQSLQIGNELIIHRNDYQKVLPLLKGKIKFDLIFIDPPFKLKVIEALITYFIDNDLLNDGAYIMAEYPKEDIVRKEYPGLKLKLCRHYSSSEVLILQKGE